MSLAASVAALRAIQGNRGHEAALLNNKVLSSAGVVTSPGANKTNQVWLNGPITAYHKPFSGVNVPVALIYGHQPHEPPMHECAAWVLASALGPPYDQLVPTTVLRDIPPDGLGSLQIEASGQREPNPPFTSAPAAVATAGFFDCLIGQQDRHPGNVRWRIPDLELIDHGFAFAKPGDRCNGSVFLGYRLSSGPATLSAKEQQALQTLSASADLLSVRPLLEANRVTALEGRIQRMLTSGNLLAAGDF